MVSESEVVLQPKHENVGEAFARAHAKLTPDVLTGLRKYITIAKQHNYSLSSEMQTVRIIYSFSKIYMNIYAII